MTTAELTPGDPPVSKFIPDATLEAIPFPVVVYGTTGVLAAMNTAAEQYWNLPREHIVGKLNLYENRHLFSGNMLSVFNHAVAGHVTNAPPVLTDLTRSESSGVAQTMTSLGVDMGKLVIRRNLRQALSYCMDRRTHPTGAGH